MRRKSIIGYKRTCDKAEQYKMVCRSISMTIINEKISKSFVIIGIIEDNLHIIQNINKIKEYGNN